MGMSRCYGVVKCLLVLLNILFLVVGLSVVGACGYALAGGATGPYRAGLAVLLAWAAALTLAAVTGLSGCRRGAPSLLAMSFALLTLTALAEAAAAWWGWAHVPALKLQLTEGLRTAMLHNYDEVHPDSAIVDALQRGLQCCGVDGPGDWQESRWSQGRPDASLDLRISSPPAHYYLPSSCSVADGQEGEGPLRVSVGAAAAGAGCGPRVLEALGAWGGAAAGAAGAGLAVLALGAALTLALCLRPAPRYKA